MRRPREIPCRMLARIVRLYVRAVSVFGKKSDAVCGFLAKSVWFCSFRTPLTPTSSVLHPVTSYYFTGIYLVPPPAEVFSIISDTLD